MIPELDDWEAPLHEHAAGKVPTRSEGQGTREMRMKAGSREREARSDPWVISTRHGARSDPWVNPTSLGAIRW